MSLFCTSLPVDLKQLKESLPSKAFLHSLTWDAANSRIVAVWEDEGLESGLVVPVDFPLADVQQRLLPKGVRKAAKRQSVEPRPELQAPAVVSSWKHPGSKLQVPGPNGGTPPGGGPPPGAVATKQGSGVPGEAAPKVKGKRR